jgi:5-formyltetrahydrofolate cyclo-ligase
VAVPKVVETEMVFYRITEFSQLIEGYKGILEPDRSRCEEVTETSRADDRQMQSVTKPTLPEHTILFVPGCAFDSSGGRMGYGGGFYDRFMEQYPDVLRVALAYEEQLVPEVPREVHDRLVDVIITESRMIQVSKE